MIFYIWHSMYAAETSFPGIHKIDDNLYYEKIKEKPLYCVMERVTDSNQFEWFKYASKQHYLTAWFLYDFEKEPVEYDLEDPMRDIPGRTRTVWNIYDKETDTASKDFYFDSGTADKSESEFITVDLENLAKASDLDP